MISTSRRITWTDQSQLGRGFVITISCCLLLALIVGAPTEAEELTIDEHHSTETPHADSAVSFINCTSTDEKQQVCMTGDECNEKKGQAGSDVCQYESGSGICCEFDGRVDAKPTSSGLSNYGERTFFGGHDDPGIRMWMDWMRRRMEQFAMWEERRRPQVVPRDDQEPEEQVEEEEDQEAAAAAGRREPACGKNRANEIARLGAETDQRVVGGTPTMFGQYPWIISMREIRNGRLAHHFCGASIISDKWALTAAHCVVQNGRPMEAARINLRIGEHDLGNNREILPHQDVRVNLLVIHPNYDDKAVTNDIALMRFAKPIRFKKHVQPVCLPSPQDKSTFASKVAYLAGWGHTHWKGKSPEMLLHVPLPVLTNAQCTRVTGTNIPMTQLCAGSISEKKDACQGDSGGPLTVQVNGRATQIGVTSYGWRCGLEGPKPGVYTRVTQFVPWINEVMQKNS